ncbi:methyltransferase domain-containing protein [candidate division GN15 bacterium]|nr:methyltransferase domain-containing protein [candidate division GN15 bacterium]
MFKKIHTYLEKRIPERPPVLRDMERYAKENSFPIVGPLVGRYLFQTAKLTKARNILELGSGYGYSAYWFSLAIKRKGNIILTDTDRENKRLALEYFKEAGLDSQFDFHVGDAVNIARKLEGPFDIIFNDIDKKDYIKTIDLAAKKLKKGGLFITDNVIWSGRVADREQDETTRAIVEFSQELMHDSRFYTTILPLRDGLAVAMKT